MIDSVNSCPFRCKEWIFSKDTRGAYLYHKGNSYYTITDKAMDLLKKTSEFDPTILHGRKIISENEMTCSVPIFVENKKDTYVPENNNEKIYYLDSIAQWPIEHSSKERKLLELHAKKKRFIGPFEPMSFNEVDMYKCLICNEDELFQWTDSLTCKNILNSNSPSINSTDINTNYSITVKGWNLIEEAKKGVGSNKVFIALSFGLDERKEVQRSIEEACRDSGFEATTVDKEHFQGGITDKIIAMINESKFVVADLTEHNNGVYFEAGYAEGLGRPVIYTVRRSDTENIHFDTKHLNQIRWDTHDELKETLFDRVRALFHRHG